MSRCLWTVVSCLVLNLGLIPIAGAEIPGGPPAVGAEPVVYLDVQASTWRSRGRISFGIEPILRMKLTSAGFTVTQDPGQPSDLTVRVEYREERGERIAVNLYGTDITAARQVADAIPVISSRPMICALTRSAFLIMASSYCRSSANSSRNRFAARRTSCSGSERIFQVNSTSSR